MRDHGTLGASREPPKRTASEVRPTARVRPWKSLEVAQEHGDALEDAADGGSDAGQTGDLADDDEHDEAGHEAGDDGFAEELRDPAQAQQADGDEHAPAVMASTEVRVTARARVAAGERAHDRAGQHRDGRDGADEEQPRRAEQGVGQQCGRQRVEADLHGDTRDDGVPE